MELLAVHYTSAVPGLALRTWRRMEEFCERYESESDINMLFDEFMNSYFSDSPYMIPFVIVDNGEIIAHAVVTMENYYGNKYINIFQHWKNRGCTIPSDLYTEFFSTIKKWGELHGTDRVRLWARNESVARLFRRGLGFERDEKVIMNSSLSLLEKRMTDR